jgi:hypothetical protein
MCGFSESAFNRRDIRRQIVVRSTDMGGGDDQAGDRVVVVASVDGPSHKSTTDLPHLTVSLSFSPFTQSLSMRSRFISLCVSFERKRGKENKKEGEGRAG